MHTTALRQLIFHRLSLISFATRILPHLLTFDERNVTMNVNAILSMDPRRIYQSFLTSATDRRLIVVHNINNIQIIQYKLKTFLNEIANVKSWIVS